MLHGPNLAYKYHMSGTYVYRLKLCKPTELVQFCMKRCSDTNSILWAVIRAWTQSRAHSHVMQDYDSCSLHSVLEPFLMGVYMLNYSTTSIFSYILYLWYQRQLMNVVIQIASLCPLESCEQFKTWMWRPTLNVSGKSFQCMQGCYVWSDICKLFKTYMSNDILVDGKQMRRTKVPVRSKEHNAFDIGDFKTIRFSGSGRFKQIVIGTSTTGIITYSWRDRSL